MTTEADRLKAVVREKYGAAAAQVTSGEGLPADCCGSSGCCGGSGIASDPISSDLYGAQDVVGLPEEAVRASLGCGNPTALAELREGDVVLDLGSGGGIDVLLSARRVGPTGKAYGLDMTDEMLALANENKRRAGATNVEFLEGRIEAIPLPDEAVDVIISNCVINLSGDKATVLREMVRVLRPGGRLGISDVVADDALDPATRAERGSFVGCIAGALSFDEYRRGLAAVGFEAIDVSPTHAVGDGMFGAIVSATKPVDWTPDRVRDVALPLPVLTGTDAGGCGCGSGGCC